MREASFLGGRVLIHCHMGLSRSVSLAAAYLINIKRSNYLEALDAIAKPRGDICPNVGFEQQHK